MFKLDKDVFLFLILFLTSSLVYAQDPPMDLVLEDEDDMQLLMEDFDETTSSDDSSGAGDSDSLDDDFDIEDDELADGGEDGPIEDDDDLDNLDSLEEDEEDRKETAANDDLDQLKEDLGELDDILPEDTDSASIDAKKITKKKIIPQGKKTNYI
jgi:hypothetical protein